jgi:hypothetical protein
MARTELCCKGQPLTQTVNGEHACSWIKWGHAQIEKGAMDAQVPRVTCQQITTSSGKGMQISIEEGRIDEILNLNITIAIEKPWEMIVKLIDKEGSTNKRSFSGRFASLCHDLALDCTECLVEIRNNISNSFDSH